MKKRFLLLFYISFLQSQHFTKVTTDPQSNDGGDSRSVNWIDYDNDGDLDLFVTNGPSGKANNFLHKNNGDGTFTKVTDASVVNDPGSYDGSTWADSDNDGTIDVYSATWYGQKSSLHRQYNGKFVKVTRGDIANEFYSVTKRWQVNVTNVVDSVDGFPVLPTNKLDQNYPNPFNPSTTIVFELAEGTDVTLTIFDSIGKEVAIIAGGTFAKGKRTVALSAEKFSSGIYYYSIAGTSVRDVKKLTVIK